MEDKFVYAIGPSIWWAVKKLELPTIVILGAGWVNTDKLKSQGASACTVTGQTASASGTISGVDNQCVGGGLLPKICNCPGGGHGTFQIAGTYKVPVTTTNNVANSPVGSYVRTHRNVTAVLPADAAVSIKSVAIKGNRKNKERERQTRCRPLPQSPQAARISVASGLYRLIGK